MSRLSATIRLVLCALPALAPVRGAGPAGSIRDVRHVVIFVQENRSFDHYFGTLRGVRGFRDPGAPVDRDGRPDLYQGGGGGFVLPFAEGSPCIEDVAHDWDSGHAAWNGGGWDRWVEAKGTTAMAYYTRAELPFQYALADAYTVCDAYHASAISPTAPNRLYVFTGTLDPDGTGGGPVIDNTVGPAGFAWTTYPERLQAAGISWKVYQQADNFDDNPLAWFARFRRSAPGDPLYDRGLAEVPDLVAAFAADVAAGTLPQVSWIVAPADDSEHPPHSPVNGARLTWKLLRALAASPAVAAGTVFMLTYDENGGFFDHVVPPAPPPGTPLEFVRGQPIGLGVRVPMILVSPWTRGGRVCSQVFDHTSILRFLERWTGVLEPNISPWRRKICGDLTSAFDFRHPDPTLPALPCPDPVACPGGIRPRVPASQDLPAQEPGRRPARPLPYQLDASAAMAPDGRLRITLDNAGTQAAPVAVRAQAPCAGGPWHFEVDPGRSAEGTFSPAQGCYDYTCYGPNGFRRRFAGAAGARFGASSRIDPADLSLQVLLRNDSLEPVTFTLTAGARRPGAGRVRLVPPGETRTETFHPLAEDQGWYDLTVTADRDARFLRVLAGHLEDGQDSVTGL